MSNKQTKYCYSTLKITEAKQNTEHNSDPLTTIESRAVTLASSWCGIATVALPGRGVKHRQLEAAILHYG